ncbi:MAG: branched-chain amino acid ABC transporter permease [Alphaproteobacteria bacterium]|nr:branched-chain amino acid ABC transporter permease [Alphaproteobacteria bacterium]
MDIATLLVAGLANGSLYSLMALGLVLVYKTQDVINFAHGEVLATGAFLGYTLYKVVGLPYPIAFVVAILLGGLLGGLIERIAFRPIAHHPHITLAMVTVGLSFALKGALRIPYGRDIYVFPPLMGHTPIMVGATAISPQSIVTIVVALMLAGALFAFFAYTTMGKQMRATQQNITGAALVGINTGRIFSFTWALSCLIGAAAGVLAGPLSLLYPDMGTNYLLKGFAAAVLGGLESVPGAMVAGLIVGVIEMLFGGLISTAFQEVSAFFIIIIVLMFRPHGLFGQKPVHRV